MRVRRATGHDARGIARVHAHSWRNAYATLLPDTYLEQLREDSLAREWRKSLKHRPALVAVEPRGEVTGFVQFGGGRSRDPGWQGRLGEIHMLYVAPEWQRRGVGGGLLEAAFHSLSRSGAFWAHVWVLERNHPARRFYVRHGLNADGATRCDTFHGSRVSVVRYARGLNSLWDAVVE